MKSLFTSLLLLIFTLPLSAQYALRTAVEDFANAGKYVKGVRSISQTVDTPNEPYFSLYSYHFEMPRKAARKQIETFLRAYNADAHSPEVTMSILHVGDSDDNRPCRIDYAYGQAPIQVGGDEYDNLALIRIPSPRGGDYRIVVCVEWEDLDDRKVDGRVHIIEGQHQTAPTQQRSTQGRKYRSQRNLNIDTPDSHFQFEFTPSLRDSIFKKAFKDINSCDISSMVVNKQDGQSITILKKDGSKMTLKIGDDGSYTTIDTDPSGRNDTTVVRLPQVQHSDDKAVREYVRGLQFYEKNLIDKNNAYNRQLLEKMVGEGELLLDKMAPDDLWQVIFTGRRLLWGRFTNEGSEEMRQRLEGFIMRCEERLNSLTFESRLTD